MSDPIRYLLWYGAAMAVSMVAVVALAAWLVSLAPWWVRLAAIPVLLAGAGVWSFIRLACALLDRE